MMDERRRNSHAPERLTDIPLHVREWLHGLDREDIARFQKWNSFITWAETTGRYGRFVVWLSLAIFGAMVSISQGWEYLARRFGG
jgi:hypothetical protein